MWHRVEKYKALSRLVLNIAAVRKCQLADSSFLSYVAMNDENAEGLIVHKSFCREQTSSSLFQGIRRIL
jgi:hypothetical protein